MKDFVVPDEFKGSHIILIICVVLATIKTCCCFCCILKHKKSRERLFACCTPTPSQANVQQPNLIPYNAVLKVESLAKDLKKHFGKLVSMKLGKKLNSDSLLTTYFKDIEPGDINKLYNIYHDDFNFFHYDI
mgnify:CR=1 FL=1